MLKSTLYLAAALLVSAQAITPARADHFLGFVGTRGELSGTGIIIFGDALINRLSDHDLLFLRLGLRREFFRSLIPRTHPQPSPITVIPPQAAESAEELDRLIRRVGELMREMAPSQQPQ